ncbi:glycosyltransferase [Thalassomonas haliotis]|uniref:Glycosyltransferase n=1 Tax=Thalassomonas haliotis TaxID=485448 RepID=A0ABY7VIS2_9GAMM|nr:glycosyltransferase [Thalassomonas haliotis]WDE13282.1 glycosyltransferase [Thalassomonas haliotis]
MKIVILPSWYRNNACATQGSFFKEQANALAALGLEVTLLYPHGYSFNKLFDCHSSVTFNGTISEVLLGYPRLPVRFRRLNHYIRQKMYLWMFKRYLACHGKPDLILAHSTAFGGAGIAADAIADTYGIPFVIMEHASAFDKASFPAKEQRAISQAFTNANKVLAVSESLKSKLQQFGVAREIVVVPNTLDLDLFNHTLYPRKSKGGNKKVFCAIGYLLPVKGFDVLLQAFSKLCSQHTDVELRIIGDGPERENLKALAKSLNIDAQVLFLGIKDRQSVAREIAEADCFVSASRSETFGVVYIEALAMGKYVIGTQCGGPDNIVTLPYGVLVAVNDSQALADEMKSFIDNSLEDCSKQRIEYVNAHFSPSVVAQKLKEQFQYVIG